MEGDIQVEKARVARRRRSSRLVWGVFLIVLGAAFLLQRFGFIDFPNIGSLWPVVFFAIGAVNVLEGRPGSGLTFMLFGLWFFANTFHWYGLDYHNSWPLLLVAVGVRIVVGALSGEDFGRRGREYRSGIGIVVASSKDAPGEGEEVRRD